VLVETALLLHMEQRILELMAATQYLALLLLLVAEGEQTLVVLKAQAQAAQAVEVMEETHLELEALERQIRGSRVVTD
jgi:uncharacterized protein YceH (UPF0502 family)